MQHDKVIFHILFSEKSGVSGQYKIGVADQAADLFDATGILLMIHIHYPEERFDDVFSG